MSGHCIAHGGKFYCYRSAEKSKRSSGGKKALPDFRECCKGASLLFFVGIIAIFIDATKQSIKLPILIAMAIGEICD